MNDQTKVSDARLNGRAQGTKVLHNGGDWKVAELDVGLDEDDWRCPHSLRESENF